VTVLLYCKEFAVKLNEDFLEKYEKDTLLTNERKFKFENLNNVFDVEIISFDGKYVEFKVENHIEKWTIDNFYIFDDAHLKTLFDKAEVYKYDDINSYDFKKFWNVSGVYILHDKEEDKYYVGQSKNINERLCGHSYDSRNINENSSLIDKRLHETNNFTLKCIKLEGSGYSNLDALETAFIAYLKSYFCGYNKTRGNKTAPQIAKSQNIDKKLIII